MSSVLAIARSSSPILSSSRNPVLALSRPDLGRETRESHTDSLRLGIPIAVAIASVAESNEAGGRRADKVGAAIAAVLDRSRSL
jgi:hypothetical protein